MSAFRQTLETVARLPPHVVVLAPSEWADTWSDRPETPVPVGLRLISETDASLCRAEAARKAWDLHAGDEDEEGRAEAYNGALMALALARAICQPEDVTARFFETGLAEDMVGLAWTSETVERLFGELEALHIRESPCAPELGAAECEALGRALASGVAWECVEGGRARRARRLLAAVIELLQPSAVMTTG